MFIGVIEINYSDEVTTSFFFTYIQNKEQVWSGLFSLRIHRVFADADHAVYFAISILALK